MIKNLFIIFILFTSVQVNAEELTDKKKQVIDELLEITGAAKIGEMMGTAVANNMITALSKQNGNLDPKIVNIIKDETGKIMHDEFIANHWLNETSYKIYHKYLTLNELREMLEFYKSPVGSKVLAVLPQITQEGMLAGQAHGQSLGPVIQKRLKARFELEGIK
jgi:hypothetical protein